jgi:AcrR family transcriptional regulator
MVPVLMTVKSRREEYAEATRQALVDAAGDLFAERGYAGTSIEDIARGARVTRGALYHHFAGKREVFSAVLEALEARTVAALPQITAEDPEAVWQQVLASFDAALDLCLDPRFQRIALIDGPAVLGWQRWREVAERYDLGLIRDALTALAGAGLIRPQPVDLLARILFAALSEAALTIAAADDPQRTRAEAGALLRSLLEGLR